MEERVVIAGVVSTHGRRGEVKARSETDYPDRFKEFKEVMIVSPGGEERKGRIESFRWHKGHVLLKFEGIETITEAEEIVGSAIEIDRKLLPPLPEGHISYADIIGFECVERGGRFLGKVRDIYRINDTDMMEIGKDEKNIMIPVIPAFFSEVNFKERRLKLTLPEGLVDL